MNPIINNLNKKYSTEHESVKTVFNHYDKNSDGFLDSSEFEALISDLFTFKPEADIAPEQSKQFFNIIDLDQDGQISHEEFCYAW